MGRVRSIADDVRAERAAYYSYQGWAGDPFVQPVTLDNYVIPSAGTVASITDHIETYSGIGFIRSDYSGIGKTTLLEMLIEEYEVDHRTVLVDEHNLSTYELVAIIADRLGVGKSSGTKLTEEKLGRAIDGFDQPVLLGVDEVGLNNPKTLHVLQFLHDRGYKLLLTGMASQFDAIETVEFEGDESTPAGKAFRRRIAHVTTLEPFGFEKTVELVQRRMVAVQDGLTQESFAEVEWESFITEGALRAVHKKAQGVPAVVLAALSSLVGDVAFLFESSGERRIKPELAREQVYADPEAVE
jgi:type II secretory pathway predicted ATPase ExeA